MPEIQVFFLNGLAGNSDTFMKAIKWIFIVVTILHIPVYLFAVRDQCYGFFNIERTKKNHLLLSLFLNFSAFSVPVVYPDVISLLGLIGGLCSTTICIIVPLLLYIRIQGKLLFFKFSLVNDWLEGKNQHTFIYKIVFVFMVSIAMLSTVFSVIGTGG